MNISIRELIASEVCMTREDGQKVFAVVHAALSSPGRITIDFADTRVFVSPFFNTAFSQLLKTYSKEILRKRLRFTNLHPSGKEVLRTSIEAAEEYYSNRHHRDAVQRAINEEAKQ